MELSTIAGVGPLSAQTILWEVGSEVEAWASEKPFASWLGLSPNHQISGGRILGRATRPVVNRVRHALRMAAYTLNHSHSALGAKFHRLKARLGAPKAIVAMARHLACLIYRMIKYGQDTVDEGLEAYQARWEEQRRKRLEKQARELNLKLVDA